jgi:hypothetical protein
MIGLRVGVLAIVIISPVLVRCTAPVTLKSVSTGQIAQCGPYPSDIMGGGNAQAQRERECIQDFQRQGYERMP